MVSFIPQYSWCRVGNLGPKHTAQASQTFQLGLGHRKGDRELNTYASLEFIQQYWWLDIIQ